MHILLIPSWYPTPENPIRGVFFREQAKALQSHGYHVGVISPELRSLRLLRNHDYRFRSETEYYDDQGVCTFRRYSWNWLPRIPKGHVALWMHSGQNLVARYIEARGVPDLIHAHGALYGGFLAAKTKERYGIPYVITEHSSGFACAVLRFWQLSIAERAFREAEKRIVVSPHLGRLLADRLGNSIIPYSWIPNSLDDLFSTAEAVQGRELSAPFRFLNIAFMTSKKGHADLLQAFAARFKGNTNIQLRLGGDGECRQSLQCLAENLDIDKQVVFLGQLDRQQVLEEMKRSDAFVLSSHYETFGIVLIEALACGKPVVATACGGPECIVDRKNGLLVPPGKPEILGRAMEEVFERIVEYDPIEIRKDCLNRFGRESVVNQLSELYKSI